MHVTQFILYTVYSKCSSNIYYNMLIIVDIFKLMTLVCNNHNALHLIAFNNSFGIMYIYIKTKVLL